MKFCHEHWTKLREAIDARGLSSLVAPDGETAAHQIKDQIEKGEATPTNYDPLMSAHWAIISNVSQAAGPNSLIYMMSQENLCPLCWANEEHEKRCDEENCTFTFDDWVDIAADEQLTRAKKLGLV